MGLTCTKSAKREPEVDRPTGTDNRPARTPNWDGGASITNLQHEAEASKIMGSMSPPRPPMIEAIVVKFLDSTQEVDLDLNDTVFAAKKVILKTVKDEVRAGTSPMHAKTKNAKQLLNHAAQHYVLTLDGETHLKNSWHLEAVGVKGSSMLELLPPDPSSKNSILAVSVDDREALRHSDESSCTSYTGHSLQSSDMPVPVESPSWRGPKPSIRGDLAAMQENRRKDSPSWNLESPARTPSWNSDSTACTGVEDYVLKVKSPRSRHSGGMLPGEAAYNLSTQKKKPYETF